MEIKIEEIIMPMFKSRWHGAASCDIDLAKRTLLKGINAQISGFWTGDTLYHIMIDGGFIVDAKANGKPKRITKLGEVFVALMDGEN